MRQGENGRIAFGAIGLVAVAALVTACSETSTAPRAPVANTDAAPAISADRSGGNGGSDGNQDGDNDRDHGGRFFAMLDDCDPATFNAAIGAGTCVGKGKTTFQQFVAELTQTHVARRWRFLPPFTEVRKNAVLVAANFGGETHTFTHVEHFGGGIVPLLNQLANTPTVAPECNALEADDFVPPGGTYRLPTRGVHSRSMKIQCCIHPWMRSVVELDS